MGQRRGGLGEEDAGAVVKAEILKAMVLGHGSRPAARHPSYDSFQRAWWTEGKQETAVA